MVQIGSHIGSQKTPEKPENSLKTRKFTKIDENRVPDRDLGRFGVQTRKYPKIPENTRILPDLGQIKTEEENI